MDISKFYRTKFGFSLADVVAIGYGSTNPVTASEVAPAGTLYLRSNGEIWYKFGAGNTDWKRIGAETWVTGSDPTANNDGVDTAAAGRKFDAGEFWFNSTNKKLWVCTDNTTATAVWENISYNGYSDYQSDATQYSETGQAYVKVKEFTFNIPSNGDYEVWAAGLVDGQEAVLDIRIDGVSIGGGHNPHATAAQMIHSFSVETLTSGNHTVEFWLLATYTTDTAFVDETRVLVKETVAGRSSKPDFSANISPKAFNQPATNSAEVTMLALTNGELEIAWYDDTTQESLLQQFDLPDDQDPNGTVTIRTTWRAKTYVASRYAQCALYHSVSGDDVDPDIAFTQKKSGNVLVAANKTTIEFSETIANLGWTKNNLLRIHFDRIAIEAGPTSLVDDFGMTSFRISINRT